MASRRSTRRHGAASTAQYTPMRPFVQYVEHEDPPTEPYIKKWSDTSEKTEAIFQMPREVEASTRALSEIYLPDKLISDWTKTTRGYAVRRLPQNKLVGITEGDLLSDERYRIGHECWYCWHDKVFGDASWYRVHFDPGKALQCHPHHEDEA